MGDPPASHHSILYETFQATYEGWSSIMKRSHILILLIVFSVAITGLVMGVGVSLLTRPATLKPAITTHVRVSPTATIPSPTVAIPSPTFSQAVTPAFQPTETSPTLQSYYLYHSDTTLIFLNFADSTDNRASTTSQTDVHGQPCLATYNELMSWKQAGNQVDIQALYVTDTPLTLNPDGTLTASETNESTGQIIIETFYPASPQAYNTALAHMKKHLAHC